MSDKKDEATSNAASGNSEDAKEPSQMDVLSSLLGRFGLYGKDGDSPAAGEVKEKPKPTQLLQDLTIEGVARYIKEKKCSKVIVMSGAGISTSAGIPDFRTPGSGLYDNLQKYNLPNPQAIFEIGFFKENPEPFFALSKELFPGKFYPTPSHFLIRLLSDKGMLLRHYTQNIDTLDRLAGVPDEKIVEAHGSYHRGHCLECNAEFTDTWMREKILADVIPKCEKCDDHGVVKPDVVFFGEALPPRVFALATQDFPECDLLIVMGTSLVVQPFASLVDNVPATTPRLLINREKCGQADPLMMLLGMGAGMDFDSEDNYRDVAYLGTCDEGCQKLAEGAGWKEELAKYCKETEKEKAKDKTAAGKTGSSSSSSSSPSKSGGASK